MQANKLDDALDVGTWLGGRRSFGAARARYSAADAEFLRTIK